MAESIDQVVQKTRAPPISPPASRDNPDADFDKKTSPPPSPVRYRRARSINPRDQSNAERRSGIREYTSPEDERYIRSGEIGTTVRDSQDETSMATFTDFFSSEIFHMVLKNPTTAHRFLKFCQNRDCGENIEFLQKVREFPTSLPLRLANFSGH